MGSGSISPSADVSSHDYTTGRLHLVSYACIFPLALLWVLGGLTASKINLHYLLKEPPFKKNG